MHRLDDSRADDIWNERIKPGTARLIQDARQSARPPYRYRDHLVGCLVAFAVMVIALVALGGCQTIAGIGEDLTQWQPLRERASPMTDPGADGSGAFRTGDRHDPFTSLSRRTLPPLAPSQVGAANVDRRHQYEP